jgi:hypothetical protein
MNESLFSLVEYLFHCKVLTNHIPGLEMFKIINQNHFEKFLNNSQKSTKKSFEYYVYNESGSCSTDWKTASN